MEAASTGIEPVSGATALTISCLFKQTRHKKGGAVCGNDPRPARQAAPIKSA